MLVKCRICGNKIDRKEAFKVSVEGKPNAFYCSKAEYNEMIEDRKCKDDTYYCIYDIFGYKVTNTVLYKEVGELGKIYGFKLILSYLHDNEEYLTRIVGREYNNEFAKIRYFTAILQNNLTDYKDHGVKQERVKAVVKYNKVEKQFDADFDAAPKYKKKKKKRRPLDDIVTEVGDQE